MNLSFVQTESLTPRQVALFFNVHLSTIGRWLDQGVLSFVTRSNNSRFIPYKDVINLMIEKNLNIITEQDNMCDFKDLLIYQQELLQKTRISFLEMSLSERRLNQKELNIKKDIVSLKQAQRRFMHLKSELEKEFVWPDFFYGIKLKNPPPMAKDGVYKEALKRGIIAKEPNYSEERLPENNYVTQRQAAMYLNVTVGTVQGWVRRKTIPFIKNEQGTKLISLNTIRQRQIDMDVKVTNKKGECDFYTLPSKQQLLFHSLRKQMLDLMLNSEKQKERILKLQKDLDSIESAKEKIHKEREIFTGIFELPDRLFGVRIKNIPPMCQQPLFQELLKYNLVDANYYAHDY